MRYGEVTVNLRLEAYIKHWETLGNRPLCIHTDREYDDIAC